MWQWVGIWYATHERFNISLNYGMSVIKHYRGYSKYNRKNKYSLQVWSYSDYMEWNTHVDGLSLSWGYLLPTIWVPIYWSTYLGLELNLNLSIKPVLHRLLIYFVSIEGWFYVFNRVNRLQVIPIINYCFPLRFCVSVLVKWYSGTLGNIIHSSMQVHLERSSFFLMYPELYAIYKMYMQIVKRGQLTIC